ncbi:MAG: hypothetical protein WBN89_11755 [Prochlorococcaceae cyanobacterium]
MEYGKQGLGGRHASGSDSWDVDDLQEKGIGGEPRLEIQDACSVTAVGLSPANNLTLRSYAAGRR